MKNKIMRQVYRLSASIIISLIMVALGKHTSTNAQNTVNSLNGLFTPTKAQQFFNEGKSDFEIKVKILNDPDYYFNQQIPQFDEGLVDETEESGFVPKNNSNRETSSVEVSR